MKLRELLLTMYGGEILRVKESNIDDWWIETTPDELVNEYPKMMNMNVSRVWASHELYRAIRIVLGD